MQQIPNRPPLARWLRQTAQPQRHRTTEPPAAMGRRNHRAREPKPVFSRKCGVDGCDTEIGKTTTWGNVCQTCAAENVCQNCGTREQKHDAKSHLCGYCGRGCPCAMCCQSYKADGHAHNLSKLDPMGKKKK